jgi:hypothetical protein
MRSWQAAVIDADNLEPIINTRRLGREQVQQGASLFNYLVGRGKQRAARQQSCAGDVSFGSKSDEIRCRCHKASAGVGFKEARGTIPTRMLFLVTQQFSLVPDLQPVPINYVVFWTQRFGGFERQFERLKRLHGMAAVSRDAKRRM